MAYSSNYLRIMEDLDLRKKRSGSLTDQLVDRAEWLEPKDRELIYAMFRDGKTAQEIAHLQGQCARHTRRHIKQLVARLCDPRVAYVVAHHEKWSKSRSAIARSLFIQGRSMRETTDTLGVSFYCVRKHREAIDAMCQTLPSPSKSSSHAISRAWRSTKG